jgi:protein-S-isoprenylcysteine O-methyltransferase Ste14
VVGKKGQEITLGYFMMGLGFWVLGFTAFQFSSMFGLYRAQKEETDSPWLFWLFRGLAYLLIGVGVCVLLYSFIR